MRSIKRGLDKSSIAVFLLPYIILFTLFIIIPILAAVGLSFTNFDTVQMPKFICIKN